MITARKKNDLLIVTCILLTCAVMLTGCVSNYYAEEKQEPEEIQVIDAPVEEDSDYSEKTLNELRQVMLIPEIDSTDISIYGKTGMGKADGIVVDAWFTGFAKSTAGEIYFCVRLGRSDGMNVSSSLAKETAIEIVLDYYGQ